MSDEFDIVYMNHEQSQEIIDWAVGTAAMVVLMGNIPESATDREKLESVQNAIEIIWNNMPDVLIGPAIATANDSVDAAIEEEQAVQEFLDEIEDL